MLIVIVAVLWLAFLLTTAAVAIALPAAPDEGVGGTGKTLVVVGWACVGAAASALWVLMDLAPAALLPLAVWYVVSGVFIARGLRAERARRRRAEQAAPALWEGTW